MHQMIHERRKDDLIYYTCDAVTTPHMFTTKFGGVSTGHLASLNLGFNRGDQRENVLKNYNELSIEGKNELLRSIVKEAIYSKKKKCKKEFIKFIC